MVSEEKQRFTFLIEKNTLEKLRELAEKERRSTSNLVVKIIGDYVDNNYKN